MTDTDTPAPIVVKASAAPIVASEAFKTLVTAGLAIVVERTLKTDTAIVAVMATSGIVANWLWGLRHRLRSWWALKFLANKVPDSVAVVGKPK